MQRPGDAGRGDLRKGEQASMCERKGLAERQVSEVVKGLQNRPRMFL